MNTKIIQVTQCRLSIWMVLPELFNKKRKKRNKMLQNFVYNICKILGAAIMLYAGIDLARLLLIYK